MNGMEWLEKGIKPLKQLEMDLENVSAATALRTTADFIGLELSKVIAALETAEQVLKIENDHCANRGQQL
ncbi:hypothetical protein [Paenibacillus senegalimassiliensis]|uniref:hypothetical protein n=1 Tax=Paenibacillus senegalimassiliensis TaxID=1737426 RepID=UPI00073E6E6B|nr:hypothetical protein [Paenibacillus senegalimassiliensis]